MIAASAGNHALGMAYHGHLLGIPVTVVMPDYARLIKITTCQKLGARVLVQGKDFTEARAVADGLAPLTVGPTSFALARTRVDQVVNVDQSWIALAILRLLELEKTVVEGSAAVSLAALTAGKLPALRGKRVGLILSGGDIDPSVLGRVIAKGLVHDGRITRFTATITDRPGGLADLTRVIADCGASIRDLVHERTFSEPDVFTVHAVCTVETHDHEHAAALRRALQQHGFAVAKLR